MSKVKGKILELSEPELRRLTGLCAKELITQLNHGLTDIALTELLNKLNYALIAKSENDVKEKIPE
jgi:hypothetical protein